jgi:hypothetical protein
MIQRHIDRSICIRYIEFICKQNSALRSRLFFDSDFNSDSGNFFSRLRLRQYFLSDSDGNSEKLRNFFSAGPYPCDENRGKIDDLIAIYGPINCALYRDKIDQFDEF